MNRTLTIFLCTDGRRAVLGQGDATEISDITMAGIKAQGLKGWVAIESGNFYGKRKVELSRVHAVEGAAGAEWDAAVAAYQASRVR